MVASSVPSSVEFANWSAVERTGSADSLATRAPAEIKCAPRLGREQHVPIRHFRFSQNRDRAVHLLDGRTASHSSGEAGERPFRTPWSEGDAALWTGSWNHAEDTVLHQRVTAKRPGRARDSDTPQRDEPDALMCTSGSVGAPGSNSWGDPVHFAPAYPGSVSGARRLSEAGHRFVNRTPLSRPPISIERSVTSPFSFRRKVMMRRSAGSCI
jgi:hypothetical protein